MPLKSTSYIINETTRLVDDPHAYSGKKLAVLSTQPNKSRQEREAKQLGDYYNKIAMTLVAMCLIPANTVVQSYASFGSFSIGFSRFEPTYSALTNYTYNADSGACTIHTPCFDYASSPDKYTINLNDPDFISDTKLVFFITPLLVTAVLFMINLCLSTLTANKVSRYSIDVVCGFLFLALPHILNAVFNTHNNYCISASFCSFSTNGQELFPYCQNNTVTGTYPMQGQIPVNHFPVTDFLGSMPVPTLIQVVFLMLFCVSKYGFVSRAKTTPAHNIDQDQDQNCHSNGIDNNSDTAMRHISPAKSIYLYFSSLLKSMVAMGGLEPPTSAL